VLREEIIFDRALASQIFDERGRPFIDLCSGGYGHNPISVRAALIDHLSNESLIQSCDRASIAKWHFVEEFAARVLGPRDMHYRVLFTGPASGMAVEMALRLARRHKGRTKVIAFTDGSHGLTDGSRAVTSRFAAGLISPALRSQTTFMPFSGFFGNGVDTIPCFRRFLEDSASGLDRPAAVIIETIQVHGGVHIASPAWLEALGALCVEFGMLLIVDESLTGCGATGPYFSFEGLDLVPDMIVASNAIAGGLPMSMLLVRPDLDVSLRDQASVIRGNGLAFAAATALLTECDTSASSAANSRILAEELQKLAARDVCRRLRVRGKGTIWGLDFRRPGAAAVVAAWALEREVLCEPARLKDEVLLIRPAIAIDETTLREGLDRLDEAVSDFLGLG
jgi:diaminobutyrate-2-oxoglutarate transaminase